MTETFNALRVRLDPDAFMPRRMHSTDAAMDLYAIHDAIVPANGFVTVGTGVHIAELPVGVCGLLVSRSGTNVRYGVTSTGLIDPGYTGEIMVALHNDGPDDVHVTRGQRISQLLILPYVPCVPIEVGDDERGDAGFGSTGR